MYNGRIPSGINQPSQSLLNVDVDGVSVLSLTTSSIYTGVSFIGSSISASFFSGSGEYLYDLQMDNVVGYKDRITSGSNVVLVDSVAGMLVNSNAIFDQDVSVTGSIAVDGDVFVGGNLTVIGSIDAFELNTTYISSSIVYASGSNIFGDAVDDRHEFTGSVYVSGAFSIPTYTGDPPNGEIGQLYFNTNNNNIYRFTGVWEAAAGESGTSGTGGTSGTSGTSGSGGTSGVDGTGGTSGTSGSGGTSGTSGSGGTSGTSGSGGTAGTSGTSGSGGSSGTTGSSGTSGVDGADGISAGRLYYLNNSQNSDVSGYKVLSEVPTAGATQTINIALSQNEQNRLVQQFITPELGFTIIPSGVQVFKLFYTIAASGDLVDAYVTIELANSVGVGYGTVVSAAAVPIQYNSGNPIEVDVNVVLSQLSINESDRMIAKLYLNNNDNQVNNVVFSTENGYYSYVITSVGVVAGTSGTSGVDGTSGTSGTNGSAGTAGTSGVDGTSGTSGFLTLEGATDNGILTLNGAAPNATVESNLTFDGSKLTVTDSVLATDRYESSAVSKRDKYWVWNTATHSIGMVDDASFGGLDSDYAMTFQMNASTGSGFLWGNDLHDNAQGAMALTTDGKLTIAKSVRVGYGESDNSALPDGIGIDVSGSALLNDFSAAGTGSVGGLLTVAGNVVPSEDDVYSLGLPDKRWDTLYLSSASLFLGNAELQGTSDGYISGAFSGSFYGDGSNLSGVTSYTDADTLDFINSIEVISGSVSIDRISGVNYGIFEITLTSSINIEHNLNTLYPIVQVYSDLGEQFIPESVVIVDSDEIKLTFGEDVSGSAIIGKGGDVIGTYTLNQYLYTGSITIDRIDGTNYSVYEIPLTESITIKHDLGFSTPLVQIYKADGEQFIPESIRALNEDTVKITIGQQISGSVVISKGGDVIGNYSSSISYVTPVWGLIQDIPVGLVSSSQQILGGDVTVSGSLEVDGALLLNSGISITGSLTTTSDVTGKLLDLNGYKYYSVSGVIEFDNNILYAFQLPNNSSGAGKLQMIHSGSDFREILWSYSNNTGSVTTKDRIFDELEALYTASIASDGIFKISTTNGKNISIFSLLETFNDGISKIGNEVYALQYLVVGGGGGGANAGAANGYFGGGGGAGGYRSSVVGETSGGNSLAETFFELVLGDTYEVSIGAGGTPNVSGSNSYFSNIISLGGGSGNWLNASNPVSNGGSGGGASRFNANNNFFGTGTAGQGFNGDSATSYGGGGGAGELGSTDADGYGGDGLQSNITGTPTYYAGGGGAGSILNSGGLGGGAQGARDSANALSATANTGGGGGGSAYNAALPGYFLGSAGGSGVVIIKFPSNLTLQGGAGLTYTEVDNGDPNTTVIRFTAGTGNISLIKP